MPLLEGATVSYRPKRGYKEHPLNQEARKGFVKRTFPVPDLIMLKIAATSGIDGVNPMLNCGQPHSNPHFDYCNIRHVVNPWLF